MASIPAAEAIPSNFSSPSGSDISFATHVNNSKDARKVETVEHLRKILELQDAKDILLSLDASNVPLVVDLLQLEASTHVHSFYRKCCLKNLRLLVKKHCILPPSLFLKDVIREGTHALRGGGFSDIWKGALGEQSVCLKVMRIHLEANEQKRLKVVKAFCEEAMVWKQLRHPNIIPLLGVNTEIFFPAFCLVAPWMSNGDLVTYLEQNPEHDRLRSVYEVASGLAYLHALEPMIIHGDIKGANVLVDNQRNCRLADFGLATIKESQRLDSTTSGGPKGTFRWMAPEVFQGETGNGADKSAGDVYAYACTVFEVMTGGPPFLGIADAAVMLKVINGARPPRPTDGWCPDHIWVLVQRCWSQDPSERPRAAKIKQYLQRLMSRGAFRSLNDDEYRHPPAKSANNMVVIRTFTPDLEDVMLMMLITTGETVNVLREYNDGWALCENAQMQRGIVPLECLGRSQSLPEGVLLFAEVTSFRYRTEKYWFRVNAVFQPYPVPGGDLPPARQLTLFRAYDDFYHLQVALVDKFPREAGREPPHPRMLPDIPEPARYALAARRELDAYLYALCDLPGAKHILESQVVRKFLRLMPGDVENEIDPWVKEVEALNKGADGYDSELRDIKPQGRLWGL